MIIKLTSKAQWGGKHHRSGTVHDVDVALAEKLIGRGLATSKIEEPEVVQEVEDAAPAE